MNSVRQSGDKKSYRVILLLVVGLTAFSSAMKELNHVREFTRDASNMLASWSNAFTPAQDVVVPAPVPHTAVKVETCESSHTLKGAGLVDQFRLDQLQSGGGVAPVQAVEIKDVGKTVVAARSKPRDLQVGTQVATLRKYRAADIEMMELRRQAHREADLKVMILADDDGEAEITIPLNTEFKVPQVKSRWRVRVDGRDDVLKSLNRSINLRSAG